MSAPCQPDCTPVSHYPVTISSWQSGSVHNTERILDTCGGLLAQNTPTSSSLSKDISNRTVAEKILEYFPTILHTSNNEWRWSLKNTRGLGRCPVEKLDCIFCSFHSQHISPRHWNSLLVGSTSACNLLEIPQHTQSGNVLNITFWRMFTQAAALIGPLERVFVIRFEKGSLAILTARRSWRQKMFFAVASTMQITWGNHGEQIHKIWN